MATGRNPGPLLAEDEYTGTSNFKENNGLKPDDLYMDHICLLFDRSCRTHTALGMFKKLRQWVHRFTWIGLT